MTGALATPRYSADDFETASIRSTAPSYGKFWHYFRACDISCNQHGQHGIPVDAFQHETTTTDPMFLSVGSALLPLCRSVSGGRATVLAAWQQIRRSRTDVYASPQPDNPADYRSASGSLRSPTKRPELEQLPHRNLVQREQSAVPTGGTAPRERERTEKPRG